MKIAIATVDKSAQSQISTRGGRAPYYLIFNQEGELLETIKNPFSTGGGGAGTGVAKMLGDKNVDIVIAGEVGEKMAESLKNKNIEFKTKEGIAEEAIR